MSNDMRRLYSFLWLAVTAAAVASNPELYSQCDMSGDCHNDFARPLVSHGFFPQPRCAPAYPAEFTRASYANLTHYYEHNFAGYSRVKHQQRYHELTKGSSEDPVQHTLVGELTEQRMRNWQRLYQLAKDFRATIYSHKAIHVYVGRSLAWLARSNMLLDAFSNIQDQVHIPLPFSGIC